MASHPPHRANATAVGISSHRDVGDIYRSLGVEPLINCAGVRTNYGASNPAPEVIAAMNAAAQAFVDLDELSDGIGRMLSELTGAEWGMVTAGTAASLALATAACIAGNDPELMLRLPDTSGMRNKVIIPADHRFAYEQAIRIAGAEIVSVASPEDLRTALDDHVAMVCLLGRNSRSATLPLKMIIAASKAKGVPILINAAGLSPGRPDAWIARGADLVVYAGGKYIRGPQSTAVVLGSKRLCQAMWRNSAPHQAFGRCMKVGKEEAVGAVVAFDRWINSPDATLERSNWLPRLERISAHLAPIPGVETEVLTWAGSVTATRLKVRWDSSIVGFDAEQLRHLLLQQRPRILIHDFWSTEDSITVDPVNLSNDEAEVVGNSLALTFSKPDSVPRRANIQPANHDLSGRWDILVDFLHGSDAHSLDLKQVGSAISGRHGTSHGAGDAEGILDGDRFELSAAHEATPMWSFYRFLGSVVSSGEIAGTVEVGAAAPEHRGPVFKSQFGTGEWRARRVQAGNQRPTPRRST